MIVIKGVIKLISLLLVMLFIPKLEDILSMASSIMEMGMDMEMDKDKDQDKDKDKPSEQHDSQEQADEDDDSSMEDVMPDAGGRALSKDPDIVLYPALHGLSMFHIRARSKTATGARVRCARRHLEPRR